MRFPATPTLLLAAGAALAPVRAAFAQCPDGTPPPCARPGVRPAAVAIDPNRVAVLPFRVTTADSLLGEGVAELLAEEFTSDAGPHAVHMGSAVRAWRLAGGGPRSPLSKPDELRVAGQLGAGLVVDGSVIGLGRSLTLSAAVMVVPGGATRQAARVSGDADSLPALIERLAASVLAVAGGGASGASDGAPKLSDSPAAVRAYLEGLAAFRRGRLEPAALAFERAYAADTLFGRAAFMRWQMATWGEVGALGTAEWARRSRALAARLSATDRIVLDAAFGTPADKERAIRDAPGSPEVWYFYGDRLYHGARSLGWSSSLAQARAAFERSVALDSQVTVLGHLVEIGLLTADTGMLRATWPGFDHLTGGEEVEFGLLAAFVMGDARLAASLRRRALPGVSQAGAAFTGALFSFGPQIGMPAADLDALYHRMQTDLPASMRADARFAYFLGLQLEGRPRAEARMIAEAPVPANQLAVGFTPDLWLAASTAVGDGDRELGAAAVERLRRATLPDSDRARAHCAIGLWNVLVLDSAFTDDTVMRAHGQQSCAALLVALRAQRDGVRDPAPVLRADSVWRGSPAALYAYSGLRQLLMGRLWQGQGNYARALEHYRAQSSGFTYSFVALLRAGEARAAALSGDTAAAVRVYREYLAMRRDAEPPLIPQRDSVRAELALLERH